MTTPFTPRFPRGHGVFLSWSYGILLDRLDKAEHIELLLKVGESVMVNVYETGAEGVVVERLDEDYVLVQWPDLSTPTVHSEQSLRRLKSGERLSSHEHAR